MVNRTLTVDIPLIRFKAQARYDYLEIRKDLDRHLPSKQPFREAFGVRQNQEPQRLVGDATTSGRACEMQLPVATPSPQPTLDLSESIVALTNSLKDSRSDVRSSAAAELGAIGSALLSAVPELFATLADADSLVRFQGAVSLEMIATNAAEVAPALNIALSSTNQDVQIVAEQSRTKVRSQAT